MTDLDGWKSCRIHELGHIQAGRQRSPHHIRGDLSPYLRVANVFDGYIDSSDVYQMKFTDSEFEQYKLAPGDLLLNEGQSLELVGRCAMYEGEPKECCFQNTLIRFRSNKKTRPEFMLALFQYLQASGRFSRIASQTTSVAHLGVSRFARLKVHLPPLQVQRKIAELLADWDRAIQSAERLLSLKERRKRTLMGQLLTGRRRYPDFVKSRKVRNTRFGGRPFDWAYIEIGEIAREISDRAGLHDCSPVFSCTKSAGLVPSLEYFGKRVFSEDTSTYKKVRKGQFAYATNHLEEGSIGLLEHADAGLVSPMYTVFQTGPAVNTTFLYALFKTELYRHIFEVYTSSSVDRRGSLRWNEFKKIHVALPPLEEQSRIAALIDICDHEIRQVANEVECLKRQKRGLMSKLLTGQVRIPHSRERM